MIPNKISIRFNPDERALLDRYMKEAGWENTSGFVKLKLFGLDNPFKKLQIEKEDLGRFLIYSICECAEKINDVYHGLEKAITIVDNDSNNKGNEVWKAEISKWCNHSIQIINSFFRAVKRIARRLNMTEACELPESEEQLWREGLINHRKQFFRMNPLGTPSANEMRPIITIFGRVSQEAQESQIQDSHKTILSIRVNYMNTSNVEKEFVCLCYNNVKEKRCSDMKKLKLDDIVCVEGEYLKEGKMILQSLILCKKEQL